MRNTSFNQPLLIISNFSQVSTKQSLLRQEDNRAMLLWSYDTAR